MISCAAIGALGDRAVISNTRKIIHRGEKMAFLMSFPSCALLLSFHCDILIRTNTIFVPNGGDSLWIQGGPEGLPSKSAQWLVRSSLSRFLGNLSCCECLRNTSRAAGRRETQPRVLHLHVLLRGAHVRGRPLFCLYYPNAPENSRLWLTRVYATA
jgi:hypothetical protein